jgi:PAS domain S-box-containing protein
MDPLFANGGEMGALMREVDWAATPLGPVAGWSQALRTVVGLLLRNRSPLLLWWGPSFIQIYNDAYRPIPGAKHPRSLGQPAAECWIEIWGVIGPMIECPFRSGAATSSDDLFLMVIRRGFVEETHFKVAYSPVPDESAPGGIGGVLATVAETTEEVYARRQLATLRDLAGRSDAKTAEQACEMAARTLEANAKDIPCALFYLVEGDGESARLVSTAGFDDWVSGEAPPKLFRIGDDPSGQRVARVLRERRPAVVDVRSRKLPSGAWEQPPNEVVLLPLATPDQATAYGFVAFAASPHRELDDAYRSFLGLAADCVTSAIRNARAYQEERERAEKLADLDRAKTLFFSNVSHEFRTPLTLMLGPIQGALSASERALSGENLETCHRNALRLLKLVNTLLDFSRIEAGRAQAAYERTDLPALTTELASVFRSAIENAGLRYVVDVPPMAEPAYVDREMWEKILLNLLSNALKFTFRGEIAVSLHQRGPHVILAVRDTGVGIEKDEVPHLFERFHQVRGAKARTHEGSGIGLALVSELVKLHGGEIHAESEPGKGTTFEVSIPTGTGHLPSDRIVAERSPSRAPLGAAAHVEEALRWLPSTPHAAGSTAGIEAQRACDGRAACAGRERILLADDNADMREYLTRLLRERWEVEAVGDGQAALEAASRRPPHLVLADVMMPGLDGFRLVQALRGDAQLREIPILLLSARAGLEATEEGLRAGADDYLVKPFTARELFARIAAKLAARKATRELRATTEETLRQHAEARIHASEERFHQLVDAISDYAIFLLDPTGHVASWNPGVEKIKGYRQEEILGQHFSVFYTPEDRAMGRPASILDAVREGGRFEEENWRVRKDGSRFWAHVFITALRDRRGEITGFAKITRDLTERRLAEDNERRLAREQLARAASDAERRRLLTLLEQVPAMVTVLLGPDLVFAFANQSAISQFDGRALLGKPWTEAVPEYKDQPEILARIRQVYETGEPSVFHEYPVRAVTDGVARVTYWNSACLAIRDPGGVVEGVMTFDLDVTAAVLAREELERVSRAKDEFLATMSHELRTPLNAMLGWATMLRREHGDEARLDRGLATIERNAQAQARLVEDLLDVSRIITGKLRLATKKLDVGATVRAAADVVRPAALGKGVRLVLNVQPELLTVGDPDRLQQIVWNLLTNAVRFTPQKGTIDVAAERAGSSIKIQVQDTGAGIAAEYLPYVFERFRQIDSTTTRAHSGLGLGLAIVRHLVEAHGGTVRAASDGLGRGATFTVTLPVRAIDKSDDEVEERDLDTADEGVDVRTSTPHKKRPLRRVRALVVEDDDDSLDLIRVVLEEAGAEVVAASSARAALEERGPFDIIISDIGMPEMDGYTLMRRLRGRSATATVPALALTAYARLEDAERALAAGYQQHVSKPVDSSELITTVQKLVEEAR